MIAAQAIINNDGKRFVFVEKDKKALETEVQVGLTDGNYYVVTEGLNVGDQLIIKGNDDLVDGQDVVVVNGSTVQEAAEPSAEDLEPAEVPGEDNAGGDQE